MKASKPQQGKKGHVDQATIKAICQKEKLRSFKCDSYPHSILICRQVGLCSFSVQLLEIARKVPNSVAHLSNSGNTFAGSALTAEFSQDHNTSTLG